MIYHKLLFEPGEIGLLHTGHDLDLAIQDMEERAVRLRDLIEQEEIMSEEYRRMARGVKMASTWSSRSGGCVSWMMCTQAFRS